MFQDRLQAQLVPAVQVAFQQLFNAPVDAQRIGFQPTRPEFEGDVTINVFPFLKLSGKGPEQTASAIGEHLQAQLPIVARYNIIKGFLNIVIADSYWREFLAEAAAKDILAFPSSGRKVMVEYASPNTNKPLHLGHLRNIFLGYSVGRILQAAGHEVIKAQVINDRGIHICKSMLAWQKFGKGETPQSSGIKGDKLVGKYYVEFEKLLRVELKPILDRIIIDGETGWLPEAIQTKVAPALIEFQGSLELLAKIEEEATETLKVQPEAYELFKEEGWKGVVQAFDREAIVLTKEDLKKIRAVVVLQKKIDAIKDDIKEAVQGLTPILQEAQEMLRQWEANDPAVRALWEKMNGWVYEGFNATYARLGVDFDRNYYESQTYVLGKEDVLKGKEQGVFYEKDGAIWVDNTPEGLDEKVLLRRDGTSVYMTQDIGTAITRFTEYPGLSKLIYTVGNEQDYHFKVLFLILKKLGFAWADELFHLSYGMVDLPSGKMKSREGTVVDADDLIEEVVQEARRTGEQLSKLDDVSEGEKAALFELIGLAALKYFLLKVDARKRMLFDPAASIDLHGHTGPFIQYTYARIRSLLRKAGEPGGSNSGVGDGELLPEERLVIRLLHQMPGVLNEAGENLDPSSLANHTYELVKAYNGFYQSVPVLKEEDVRKRALRLALSAAVAATTKKAMWCLGIEVPERM